MVGADDVSRIEVQAVVCQPARADAGVEMHLAAAQALSLGVNPPEQFAGEASSAGGGHGGQVVDVYMPSPAQAGTEPEAGDGHCVGAIIWQHTHQPVASRPLNTVDLLDEVLQASWLGPAKSVRSSQVWCSRVRSDGRSVDGARSTAQRKRT
jgi:hypothetical protein